MNKEPTLEKKFTGHLMIGWYVRDDRGLVDLITWGYDNDDNYTYSTIDSFNQYSRSPNGPWLTRAEAEKEAMKW